ncbi:uncharacterized protein HaLaN_09249 [Haematococcus lacustris]|uniref:Uncharacterized protein n=1 Tax=Haematococcus lacustris TaxID=44745 RepID=A0A699YW01_HAELA|nr:uncharacterized protein HaLaN_09249 [Haematococcus lacustris]
MQEPTLFATTIFGNIAMGKEGATEAEVQAAAEAANAHTFISHQPKGYQTQVGERGLQMSGGQKQRIAIARAILKNPRIMLLDEATSALDTQSERLVQDALNRMIVGRTTVVVAHRLSTIKDADIIAVVQAGAVVEQGSHQELIANPEEWRYGLVGLLASAVCGAIQPAFAFIMASFVTVFYTGQVGWFDREENSSGVLTTKLGSDASYVRGAVGDTLGLMLQNVLCLAFGYVIALVYDWRMALVVTGALPFMIIGSIIYYRTITGNDSGSSMKFAKANQAVSDAFSSVRVVQAYNLQGQVLALYTDLVAGVTSSMRMQSHYTGALMGYSQFSIFAVYGLIIYFGGVEVSSGRVEFEGMLKSFLAILLAAMGIAQAQIGFPDIGKAKDAVKSIFPIIDRKSQIDSSSQEGVTSPPRGGLHLEGQIQLQDVTFRYPARPTVTVFKGFTLDIPAGQTVALVGESGSGKSTIVGLVLRYYDVVMGQLLVDGLDVRSYNLRWLRSHIGLVSQEPLLFSCSVGDNIRYGLPGASQEEVEAAARAANAHDFISALPEGYNTHVGERGVQLSGGQKQRVAIARAVVKNPRIMLLDEATSALDAHAEKVVQDALDHIMVGRTSVVVAHRLSTIRNADKIALVYRGTILEQGTHAELMALPDGGYARLVAAQNGQRAPTNQGTLPVSKSELAFANAADGQP